MRFRSLILVGVSAVLALSLTSPLARAQDEPETPTAETDAEEPEVEPGQEPVEEEIYEPFLGSAAELARGLGHVTLTTVGKSRGGRDVELLTVLGARDGEPVDAEDTEWVALVVAGLSGLRDRHETRLALEVAVKLAENADEIPEGVAFQFVLDGNPDATAFAATAHPRPGNDRAVDDDQDGEVDEDPADDLDGDGRISWMRLPDPTGQLSVTPDDDADPTAAVAPVLADPAAGKPRTHRLVWEGRDDDRDGLYNEDGPGGVDVSANFPWRYEEHVPGNGPWAASEPETRALMDHLLADQRIAVIYEFGGAETLAKQPGWDGAWPKLPKDDQSLLKELGKAHGEPLGDKPKRTSRAPGGGSLGATAWHQLGLLWFGRAPNLRTGPPWPHGGKWPQGATVEWRPVSGRGIPKGAELATVKGNAERSYAEVGAARDFLLLLARGRPRLAFTKTRQAGEPGILRVRTTLVNSGRLPTHTARGAQVKRRRPVNVWARTPEGVTLLAGRTLHQVERIEGGGETDEMRWVFRGPSHTKIVIEAVAPDAGVTTLEVEIP